MIDTNPTPSVAVEQAVRIVIPDGCQYPGVSFGTSDPAVMHRAVAEHHDHDDFRAGPNYVVWTENGVKVQVSYVGRGSWRAQQVTP